MRTTVLRLALVVALACVALAGATSPAGAHAGRTHYTQFNMWGKAGHDGGILPAVVLANRVDVQTSAGHTPLAISLQELCSRPGYASPSSHLIDRMPGHTFGMYPTVSYPPDDPTSCKLYGVGLGMVGPRTGPYEPDFAAWVLAPDTGEDRAIVCGLAWFGNYHTACSTHLDPDTADAQQQLPSALSRWIQWQGENPSTNGGLFGGDLNLIPGEMEDSVDLYDLDLIEADPFRSPTFNTQAASLTRKYDYAFVPSSRFTSSTATRLSVPSASDHAILEGHFQP